MNGYILKKEKKNVLFPAPKIPWTENKCIRNHTATGDTIHKHLTIDGTILHGKWKTMCFPSR